MLKVERQTVWGKFQKLVNSQILQVELTSETSEKLQRLRKDLDKSTNGNRSHLEFRLISYCSVRILQLCYFLWTKDKTKMCSSEDKEAIKKEIRDSLLNLELRLGKYTDDVIYRHFNENDSKFRKEEERLFDTIEQTFMNQAKAEVSVKSIKDKINNICERARDIGYNIGELTLSNDMAEILNIIKLLSKSFSGEKNRNSRENPKSKPTVGVRNRTVCLCENQSTTSDSGEIIDLSSDYTESDRSPDWTTARNTALRIKNIPKLDFQFLHSDQEMEEVDRKYSDDEVSCWSSKTSSYVEEELNELNGETYNSKIIEKSEASSVYESFSLRYIPSDIDSEFRSNSRTSSCSQTRTSARFSDHPNCYGSFTLISRNQETAISDRLESLTMNDLSVLESNDVNYSLSTEFDNFSNRTITTMSSRTTQSNPRKWISSDIFYGNTFILGIGAFCLLLLRMTWVYFCSDFSTRNILKNSFFPELDRISILLDCLYSNMEIKYYGVPPV